MTERTEPDRRTSHFGTVTASLSHELGNVLATVQEAAGLMHDYVAGAEEGELIDAASLAPVLGRIDRSVTRGLDLVRLLNWIAHSIDQAQCRPDLAVVIEKAAASARYFARQCCVEIEVPTATSPGVVAIPAVDLHLLLFACFRFAIDIATEGAVISCEPGEAEKGRIVSFVISGYDSDQAPPEQLVALLAAAGVRLDRAGTGSFALFLPDADETGTGADSEKARRLVR